MCSSDLSRRALFDEIERSALKKLPATEYAFAYWKQCRAGVDYHVEIEKHYYSVPYTLVRQELWASYTASTVEVFGQNQVAADIRDVAAKCCLGATPLSCSMIRQLFINPVRCGEYLSCWKQGLQSAF